MFVVLTVSEQESGILNRLRSSFRGKNCMVKRRSFMGNYYYHIHLENRRIPWGQIASMAGRTVSRLVMPEKLTYPNGFGIGRYDPLRFMGEMTIMAAAQLLDTLQQDDEVTEIGLIDLDGVWMHACRRLLPLITVLRVCTARPERYESLCRSAMDEWGTTVMVGSMNQNLQNCSFLISPTPTGVMRTSLPVLTVDHSGIQGRPTINRLRFDLPPQILSEIPDGLEPLSFLGAAYECGTRRFELSFPLNGCRVDGRLVTTGELAALLMKKKKAEIRVENRT